MSREHVREMFHKILVVVFLGVKCYHSYKEGREEEGEKVKHEEKSHNCLF